MELIYLWVDNNKNIKSQGFNFSPNYHIENLMSIEEKDGNTYIYPFGTIRITAKSKVPKFLFGHNIINITAIIGENGTGKTNILKIIRDEVYKNLNNKYIFNDKDFSNTKDNLITFKTSEEDKIVYIDQNKLEPSDFKDERTVIYYDNIFQTQYNQSVTSLKDERLINISTGELYNQLREKYDSNEIKNQMIFIRSKEANLLKKELPELIFPRELSFSNINDGFIQYQMQQKKEYTKFLEIESNVKKEIDKELNHFNNNNTNDDFKEAFILSFQITILKIALVSIPQNDIKNRDEEINKFIEIFSEFDKKLKDFQENNSQKYTSLGIKGDSEKKRVLFFKNWNKEIENLLKKLDLNENLKIIYEKNIEFLKNQEKEKYYALNRLEIDLEKNGENLKELMSINKENSIEFHFFEYKWMELSSGEKAVLALFSRFYSVKNKINSNFILILLDEPELYFHPEWQRKFIKIFVKFINEIFKENKIQIIMTSHSPFVASDLPKENVIMLGKYKETDEEYDTILYKIGGCKVKPRNIDTFGANIFDLYSKAFFVESSFGEFAKEKIQDIVKKIEDKKYYENKEEIDFIVNSIGEPLIKNKLLNMIKENQSKEDRISELEQELAKLRGDN